MKILLVGDVHGNHAWLDSVYVYASEKEANIIVQLGDLGWGWPQKNQKYPPKLVLERHINACVAKTKIPFWFLAGNHDNWNRLPPDCESFEPVLLHPLDDRASALGFELGEDHDLGITYIPRGAVWQWGSCKFGALGGALSIDKAYRLQYYPYTYWERELPPPCAVENLLEAGPLDVLLCHDAPLGPDIFSHHRDDYYKFPESYKVRSQLRDIVDVCQPKYVFHGHHHVRYGEYLCTYEDGSECIVEGLDCDGSDIPYGTKLLEIS